MVMLYVIIRRIILKRKSMRDSLFRKEIYVSLDLKFKEVLLIFFLCFAFFICIGFWTAEVFP